MNFSFRWLKHWPSILWALSSVSGFAILALYANTPSPKGTMGDDAAPGSLEEKDGYRVYMFVHPKCACSRASLVELKEAVRNSEGAISEIRFYVTVPGPGQSENWKEAKLVEKLRPWGFGSTVHFDPGGRIAEHHGVLTSGHVVAFSNEGKVVFSGGVTGSRGHQGDNPSRRKLEAALAGNAIAASSPVFGCQLQTLNTQSEPLP